MHLDVCNGFLQAIGLLNDGVNHGTTYAMEALPPAASLDSSLAAYFSAMSTSHVPPQPPEQWQIRIREFDDNWEQAFRLIVDRWFFRQKFSPKVPRWVADNVVEQFIAHVQTVVGGAKAFLVQVSPPMWYEGAWEDVAFDAREGRWILHLGVSD